MTHQRRLESISDEELLRRLSELLQQSRRVESELVAHIGEVDDRRLYARQACSSMFSYSTEVLHLSEHEAYLRITAARASRKHPMLLSLLAEGRLHLSGIAKLAPLLTVANREEVLARAAGKSKREIEELVAELSPRPDAPPAIRKLPARAATIPPPKPTELGPDRVLTSEPAQRVEMLPAQPIPPAPVLLPSRPPLVQPLAPARYKVTFTASASLRDKLERLQALMDEDLAAVIEAAVTEKLERLQARRYAETKKPRKKLEDTDTSPKSRYLPAAVRRVVRKRDGDQCRFVDKHGRRCTERRRLQFHHHEPFGRGGDHDPAKISLFCPAHNAYLAELEYGKEKIERYRRSGSRVREPAPIYSVASRRRSLNPMERVSAQVSSDYGDAWGNAAGISVHLPPLPMGNQRQ